MAMSADKAERLLEEEAVRTEFYMWFDEDQPQMKKGVAFEEEMAFSDTEHWFREMIEPHIESAVEMRGADMWEVWVAAQAHAGLAGYGVSQGVPKKMLPLGAIVLFEGADNPEVEISLEGAPEDFLRGLLAARYIDSLDDEYTYTSVIVQYTVYLLPEED